MTEIDMTGISRIEQHGDATGGPTNCWWVRLFWSGKRPLVHRSFPDLEYGGKPGALEAAAAWRDRQRELWAPALARRPERTVG